MIKINFLNFNINYQNSNYILFTSKNSVKSLDNSSSKWKNLLSICIGESTANEVRKRGGKVDFIASKSYGDELAKEIVFRYKKSKIIFPRAKKILSNIVEVLLKNGFEVEEVQVYETICQKQDYQLDEDEKAIIIFTSPSTIKCFLENYNYENIYKAIAIGEKTASFFDGDIIVSDKQSIKRCIEIAKSMV